jgi:hypothetical protein
MLCLLFDKPIVIEPKFFYTHYNPIDIEVASDGNRLLIQIDRALNNNAEILLLYMTRQINQTINNPGSRLRLIICDNYDSPVTDIKGEYESTLGTMPDIFSWVICKWQVFGFVDLALSYNYYKKTQVSVYV